MGRLRNLVRRVRDSVKDMVEEANYPGVSPPHRQDREDRFTPEEPEPVVVTDSSNAKKATSGVPWYLEGTEDAEGWENTDATAEGEE